MCREAPDSRTALATYLFTMLDAILLDWNLPGVSGLECLKAIRAMPGLERPNR